MADRAQGAISFTPIVTILADSDADAVDAIHHNIKGSLGGELTVTAQDLADKWFYAPNLIVTTTSDELIAANDNATDLVGASGVQGSPNAAIGTTVQFTDGTAPACNADKTWFLFVRNTGTSDISNTTTTNSVYLCWDGGTAAYNNLDNIEIQAGQAWMGNIAGPVLSNHFIITGQARGAGTASTVNGSTSVRCTVAALIEDVSA